jgi:AraC-like DNA-binding protein
MRAGHLALVPRRTSDEQVWITQIDLPAGGTDDVRDLTRSDHRQYLFVYAGGCDAELDGWTVALEPGEILFIPSRTIARLVWRPGLQAFWIGIADEFLMSRVIPALGIPFAIFRSDFNTPKKLGDWTGPTQSENRKRLWDGLMEAQRRLGPVGNTVVAAYVLIMLFEKNPYRASASLEEQPANAVSALNDTSAPDPDLATVMAFRSLIEEHLIDKWSVRKYCDAMALRSIELVESCKKVLGCTPSEMISDRLLLEAKRQLTYSNTSSAAIAYDLGFNDAAYFSRFFKRRTGLSPSEFRRSHAGRHTL